MQFLFVAAVLLLTCLLASSRVCFPYVLVLLSVHTTVFENRTRSPKCPLLFRSSLSLHLQLALHVSLACYSPIPCSVTGGHRRVT